MTNRTADARWMVVQLADHFGAVKEPARDPVEMLVLTILSQNTTDTNRDRAFASLLARFGSLSAVAKADAEAIAEAIRIGGLQTQKSRSIRSALQRILSEHGKLTLDFLEHLPVADAMDWLLEIPGVGRKTAGIVCLFSFDLPYFPIDTHIRRVLTRVGWIQDSKDPHRQINLALDADAVVMASLHLLVIRLGRTLCSPRSPQCAECPIRDRCRYGRESVQ